MILFRLWFLCRKLFVDVTATYNLSCHMHRPEQWPLELYFSIKNRLVCVIKSKLFWQVDYWPTIHVYVESYLLMLQLRTTWVVICIVLNKQAPMNITNVYFSIKNSLVCKLPHLKFGMVRCICLHYKFSSEEYINCTSTLSCLLLDCEKGPHCMGSL